MGGEEESGAPLAAIRETHRVSLESGRLQMCSSVNSNSEIVKREGARPSARTLPVFSNLQGSCSGRRHRFCERSDVELVVGQGFRRGKFRGLVDIQHALVTPNRMDILLLFDRQADDPLARTRSRSCGD